MFSPLCLLNRFVSVINREYDSAEVTDFMKEEKKRKQMEAVAEDLFNNEKVSTLPSSYITNLEINPALFFTCLYRNVQARKRGTARNQSIRGFLS